MHRLLIWFDYYTDWLGRAVLAQSALAPLLLLFLEEAGVPILIPGDSVLAYTGYKVAQGNATPLWLAFAVALFAVLAGASILFFVSRRYGQFVVDKIGKFIFLKESHIKRAENLFKKYGAWTIIIGRHIPGMRIPITIFAATSGVKYRTFILSTIVSTLAWVLLYLHLGKRFGENLHDVIHRYTGISIGVIAAVILLIIGLHIIGVRRENKKNETSKK